MAMIVGSLISCDMQDGGSYTVSGVVTRLGIAGPYPVALFERASRRLVRQTLSGSDGSYVFLSIAYIEKGYFAVAFDYSAEPVNAVISDYLTPVPMS
jgi:hypothetical protein